MIIQTALTEENKYSHKSDDNTYLTGFRKYQVSSLIGNPLADCKMLYTFKYCMGSGHIHNIPGTAPGNPIKDTNLSGLVWLIVGTGGQKFICIRD